MVIKAVLIDDERPALRELEFLLKKYSDISIIGAYIDPLTAIEKIGELKPQVVFLDINMPQLRGIDAASRILDISSETDIIFVTAFDQYALEAFELHALDYILKPINVERLEKTIERIMKRKLPVQKNNVKKLQMKCLGQFSVTLEDQVPIKWRAEKTKELFAFMLENQGRDISKEELLDKLWPEDAPDKAIRQVYNGIYYIRKALEEYGVDRSLIGIDSNYHLRLGEVDLDVFHFHEFEKNLDAATMIELEDLEARYTGDYLESEYYSWADLERERLLNLYLQCLIRLSKNLMEEHHWDRAERYLMKAYHKNPYDENVTELLLRLYMESGNKNKAVRHFNEYTNLIREELGVEPNEKLQRIMGAMKQSII